MKTLLHAAIAALSVASISSAIAGEGEGTIPNTQFTVLSGVVAQAPEANASPVAMAAAQDRGQTSAFITQSNHAASLFPAHDGNDG